MSDAPNPFASPQTTSKPPRTKRKVRVYAFASPRLRAIAIVICLGLTMVCSLASVAVTYREIRSYEPNTEKWLTESLTGEIGLWDIAIALAGIVFQVATVVAFLMWFHRVHRNLRSLGNDKLKYSPLSAVCTWFVPVLNLFRPCQIMIEIWKGSHPDGIALRDPQHGKGSPLVGLWWASFLLMYTISRAAGRAMSRAESNDQLLAASWASLVGELIAIVAAAIAIAVVLRVTANQERRRQLLGAPQPAPPAKGAEAEISSNAANAPSWLDQLG